MNGDNPPASVPAGTVPPNPPTVLSLVEVGKKTGEQWTLTLHPAHLALADAPGAQPYVILRQQMMKTMIVLEGACLLIVNEPKKLNFKMSREGTESLVNWIGRPFLARYYLRRRYSWVGPLAIFWVLASLLAFVPAGDKAGATPADVFGMILGCVLLVSWVISRWRPHPALFLVDSVWFALLAVYWAMKVMDGSSKTWLILVAFGIISSVSGARQFMRFRGTKLEHETK